MLITDEETGEIAAALATEVREVGAALEVHVLEAYGTRPMRAMPAPNIRCDRPDVVEDLRAQTSAHENANRVGEFAIGTNVAVRSVIGHILQGAKIPGLHLAFGHPYAEHTGATWTCPTHLDIVGRRFDIWMDGEQIVADGEFLV